MAIEFYCPECHKLLSVPDGSEGQQARCPACSAICNIPAAGATPPSESGPPAPGSSSADADNPYAAPSIELSASDYERFGESGADRNGPAWERDEKSVSSFVETVKEMFTGPGVFGRRMRRTGGLGAPLRFGMIGGGIGGVIGMIWEEVLGSAFAMNQPRPVIPLPFLLVCFPLLLLISFYIHAGIVHLMLSMLGAARCGFETTFRVITYTTGATNLLMVVPFLGGIVAFVVQIVFSIIALAESHEISGGKAAAAVLIPLAVCCGFFVVLIVLVAATFVVPAQM